MIIPIDIRNKLSEAFLTYAKAIIEDRAIPSLEDGLKPVQRRILYAMLELGLRSSTPHKKCARIVGECMGKFHPHGDSSIYSSLVNVTQEFTTRYPLVDGQGNFGSLDDDPAAAMRYTEARLTAYAEALLEDLKYENIVKYIENFDSTLKEPTLLPTPFPNLLLNGSNGIAVGIATSILPHNLEEILNACIALIINEDTTLDELLEIVEGPDLPTGCYVLIPNKRELYETGNGNIIIRAKIHIEGSNIIITEIPYQTDKVTILKQIVTLHKEKRIDGITEIRDESNKEGIRIVIETELENPKTLIETLYQKTKLQNPISSKMIALYNNQPKTFGLKELLIKFLHFRYETIRKKLTCENNDAKTKLEALNGLSIAVNNIEKIVAILKKSKTHSDAKQKLIETFNLTENQAKTIFETRLSSLIITNIEDIEKNIQTTNKLIHKFTTLLNDSKQFKTYVLNEYVQLKMDFTDKRRSEIVSSFTDISYDEKLFELKIKDDKFIKTEYEGGKVSGILISNTDAVSILTNTGQVFISTTIHNMDKTSSITTDKIVFICKATDEPILCITKNGYGCCIKPKLKNYNAIIVEEDEVVFATNKIKEFVCLISKEGFILRFSSDQIKITNCNVKGVRLIRLASTDYVKNAFSVTNGKMKIGNNELSFNNIPLQCRDKKGLPLTKLING